MISEVARLLTAARAMHFQKKHFAGKRAKDGTLTPPNYPEAERCIFEALTLRQQADALDPDHADPAWRFDLTENKGIPHERLMASYREYLTTDPQSALAREFIKEQASAKTGAEMRIITGGTPEKQSGSIDA